MAKEAVGGADFDVLLDWLDKVRIGMWLGLMQLDGNPWGVTPKFHISQRVALHDRCVGVCLIEARQPGINLLGPESPCFAFSPTAMCIFINNIGLFNSSAIGLCSRRLGFPYPATISLRVDGFLDVQLASGLERVLRPIERGTHPSSIPFIYQPIFERGVSPFTDAAEIFNTEYVRSHSLDFERGRGNLFLQTVNSVSHYGVQSSLDGSPRSQYRCEMSIGWGDAGPIDNLMCITRPTAQRTLWLYRIGVLFITDYSASMSRK